MKAAERPLSICIDFSAIFTTYNPYMNAYPSIFKALISGMICSFIMLQLPVSHQLDFTLSRDRKGDFDAHNFQTDHYVINSEQTSEDVLRIQLKRRYSVFDYSFAIVGGLVVVGLQLRRCYGCFLVKG